MAERPLWTSEEAEAATGGRSSEPWSATGVSIDTRTLEPGDLYIAIVGDSLDGHDYVAAGFENRAAACLVSQASSAGGKPALVVEDTFAALNALGGAARARTKASIAGITGSVGKTSTKEALRFILEKQGATAATTGNLNNHWGVPLSLARMPARAAYGVFELGMNSPGEITPLSRLVRPHVALITTIAPAHTEFFDSLGEVADAKAEIFNGMNGGVAVLNRDNAYFPTLAVAAHEHGLDRVIGFGAHPEATARLLDAEPDQAGSDVTAQIDGTRIAYRIGQPGRHWIINSLGVLATASALGADLEQAAGDLADIPQAKGRGERFRVELAGGPIDIIDDSYNASPASMRAAFETLSQFAPARGGRRIVALGDMLELGPRSPALHAGLAEALLASGVDLVFTAGPEMAHLAQALPQALRGGHAADSAALASLLGESVRAGDVVTVKGSLGSRMAIVVEALKTLGTLPPAAVNG
ncbi:MAG: UDP-N-acetylmuramoylalanyl-D-glutamyl-2,6-diaminopimelate--D-alanyl-D-alanine ligase [Alphaproteobacteria bacterium]